MTIAELAARNRANRMAQLSRLAPVRQEAKAKAAAFYDAQKGAKTLRADLDVMSRLRHVPNFFPTPRGLVERMIQIANLDPSMTVLEPSAGKGNIALAIRAAGCKVVCIEKVFTLAQHLESLGLECACSDFLTKEPEPFDRVILNPPFERGIDEDHILHAVKFLKPGGRLVGVISAGTASRIQIGEIESLPEDTFRLSERPTGVRTALITIDN